MASLLTVSKAKRPIPGSYIITLKEGVSLASHINSTKIKIASTPSNIIHEYKLINGYAGKFSDDDLNDLRAHTEIASIEEDGTVWACEVTTQTDAPWGLGRITSTDKLTGDDLDLTFTYKYDSSAGAGTNVYILDTGIYTKHSAFGGRAKWGKTFGDYENEDGNGHGTHCAGTAVSDKYGVAKAANVFAVKVLADDLTGARSDLIAGMLWVGEEALNSGKPSVASLSLACDASDAVDKAVNALCACGVTVVASAGNEDKDAVNYSPARAQQAITVAGSTFEDTKADFSNYGKCVDIWAAGKDVISTWIDGKTQTLSGTSMAAPHVSGLVAILIGRDTTLTPADVAKTLSDKALDGIPTDAPTGTVKKLLHYDV